MGTLNMPQVWHVRDEWNNRDVLRARVRLETIAALLIWVTFGLGLVYMTPTMLAVSRDARESSAIGLLNLALGWTGIGWVLASSGPSRQIKEKPLPFPAEAPLNRVS